MEAGKYQLRDMFFPHHDGVLPDEVDRCVKLLHKHGLVIRYTSSKGVGLIQLPKTGNYQIRGNMSVDSDFPAPTTEEIQRWEQEFGEKYVPLSKAMAKPTINSQSPDYFVVVECWNKQSGLPSARFVTAQRREKLKLRWKSQAFREHYESAISKVAASDFCQGKNSTGWRATFDWFIRNDDNWCKAYEGKYDNKRSNKFDSY